MKKVIVTGVTGQVGSYMADFLLQFTNLKVYGAIRRLSVPNHENIKHIKDPNFKLVEMDLGDEHSIASLIEEIKPDYFINFAANSFVGNSWKMPVNHFQNNTMGVLHQLEAIRKHCPSCRYYNAGSSEEFGDVIYSPQDLNHPSRPRSPYGASKVAARQIVKVWRDSYDLFAIQGYLFNHECLSANTPVLISEEGKIRIDYIRNLMPERADISKENSILTKEFDNLKIWDGESFVDIKAISRKKINTLEKTNQKLVLTNTRNGVVETTPNHSLFLNAEKTQVKKLKIKDEIDHLSLPNLFSKINLTPQQCKILGYLVGDGYVSEYEIQFVNQNVEILNDFIECIEQTHSNAKCRIENTPSGFGGEGSKRVVVSGISKVCKTYKEEIYDKKTKHKKVPDNILNSGKHCKEEFFKAYYACDGLKNGEPDFQDVNWTSFKTNSPILAHGLILIFEEITNKDFNINVFEQNEKIYYQVNLLSGSNKGVHLLKNKKEIKKTIARDVEDCFVYDIETETGYFSGGVGKIKVGNSERRGEEFVTRKITKAVARICKSLSSAEVNFEPLELGNLDAKRDWSHAEDFVRAVWLMLNEDRPKDYLLASGETHTVREFVELAFANAGIKGHWTGEGLDEKFKFIGEVPVDITLVKINPDFYRPAEVELLLGDPIEAQVDLHWKKNVDFPTLVRRMVQNDLEKNNAT